MNAVVKEEKKLIKLDIGCGPNKAKDHMGMDAFAFPGVDIVHDLRVTPWPLEDASVESANCSHVLEHLTNFGDKWERVKFFNELYRVLVPVEYTGGAPTKGFCRIVIPHWASNRFYGDPTHKEPFGEMAICYLDPDWRKANAPHTDIEWNKEGGYNCHFACTYDYSLHQNMAGRNQEYVQMAVTHWKEAAQDLIITASKVVK